MRLTRDPAYSTFTGPRSGCVVEDKEEEDDEEDDDEDDPQADARAATATRTVNGRNQRRIMRPSSGLAR
jgi:hypothetical protein